MSKKRILFIVNPISGHHDKKRFRECVARELGGESFSYDIIFTEYAGHATELSLGAVGRYDIVAAVGGDGTLNEVAHILVGTDTTLAVIPYGSGNGLARCLHIPLNTEKALRLLQNGRIQQIDTGSAEHPTEATPTVCPSTPSSSKTSATRRCTIPCVHPGQ